MKKEIEGKLPDKIFCSVYDVYCTCPNKRVSHNATVNFWNASAMFEVCGPELQADKKCTVLLRKFLFISGSSVSWDIVIKYQIPFPGIH